MSGRADHHSIYVVELDRAVLENRKFRVANPNHRPDKPCVYVGLTGISPEQRFLNHKRGVRAARLVKRYGMRLRPRLYARFNPMSYREAVSKERELAARLRKRGYAVWQN